MADILAFVKTTQRSTRAGSAADNAGEVVVFPGASVGMLKAWDQPDEQRVAAAMESRIDN